MTTILTTTGISLHINTGRNYDTKDPTDEQMWQYLDTKPEIASAEVNSLLQIAQAGDHLVFLHTETPIAKKCVALLRKFFISRGFQPYQIDVKELQFQENEEHIETHGLRNLVNTLISEIEAAQRAGQQVVINATPGFKLESGYSTVIGMLYQVPVKYIHEKFRRVVTFNPIALDWNTSLFLTYDKFFQWLDENEGRIDREVETRLKGIPDKERIQALLTPPDEKGFIFLSPMGEVFRRRFARETQEAELVNWPLEVQVKNVRDKIARSIVRSEHHYPKGTEDICEKIAQLPWVHAVMGGNFENTTLSRIKGINEDGTIRLLWADDEKATNLIVQTTAQGRPQTRKVAEKIREVLEIE